MMQQGWLVSRRAVFSIGAQLHARGVINQFQTLLLLRALGGRDAVTPSKGHSSYRMVQTAAGA